ncbi:hypothetical protein [Burkholderia cepacia]|uniref:hypothetical protein n=1 Tax=Burkholderia cepacia TaxID=292 RepID=UPI001F1CBF7B|nr:hypothetical protein [Burkholderia cepacia]MCE4125418.1 hypothetical protein [Burkholderia cepacia]
MSNEKNYAAVRVCAIADIECSRGCGTGACKREQPAAAPFYFLNGRSEEQERQKKAQPASADERAAFDADDLDFEPDAQHTVADMANIGYALLEQIARMAPGYNWNDSPVEIVSDLISERDEARSASASETGAEGATQASEEFRQIALNELYEFQELTGCSTSDEYRAKLASMAAEVSGECFVVIGHGESDIPEAKIITRRDDLLDAVLGMMYWPASDAPDDVRAEYAEALADEDEWAADTWSVSFEIGGIVVWRVGLHPFALPRSPAMVAEAVAWWRDPSKIISDHEYQNSVADEIKSRYRPLGFITAPQPPAQAAARVGLTDEQREAIDFVIGWYEQPTIADNPYREHIAALRALLEGANQ